MKKPKNDFLISIIMSVYNVEAYIEEAFESLEAQTLGFQENIQIILVNDGSTDDSGELCKRFQDKYPENTIYIEKENGGPSSARNAGLKYADGKLINFFDPDDMLSSNACEEVWAFFLENWDYIDCAALPLYYFEDRKGLHPKYKFFQKKNYIVDLSREPWNVVFSSAAMFYKSAVFKHRIFDESLGVGEDVAFNLSLFQERMQFGYVSAHKASYQYRIRSAGTSIISATKNNADACNTIISILESLYLSKQELLEYEKEAIVYQCQAWIPQIRRDCFETDEDYIYCVNRYRSVVAMLDEDFICRRTRWVSLMPQKAALLAYRGSSISEAYQKGVMGRNWINASIRSCQLYETYVKVELLCYTYECPFEIAVRDDNGITYTPIDSNDLHSSFDIVVGDLTLDITHYRTFKLPLKLARYSFFIRDKETEQSFPLASLVPSSQPPLQTASKILAPRSKDGYKLILGENTLTVEKDCDSDFIAGVKSAHQLKKQGKPVARLRPLARRQKRYILINDRPQKAGDNGQALFEYIMRERSSELKKRTFFVLDKNCDDYQALKQYGSHIVQPKSARHKYLFLNASHIYSSHNARQFYLPFAHNGRYYADLFDYKFVWLQHGVTQNGIARAANRLNTNNSYIISASQLEAAQFQQPEYFYAPCQICVTGFARFDRLESEPANVITLAPTWRVELSGKILSTGYHEPLPGFENSLYYQTFRELLTSRRLLDFLATNKLRLDFVLHPGVACYEEFFNNIESEHVRVVPQHEANYSRIFRESLLFITDYSSAAFDFAYLRKPVLYFQFDEEEFFTKHYKKGYFDYRRDGFGEVLVAADELVDAIIRTADNGFQPDEIYLSRMNSFFAFNDKNNCKRILEATLETPCDVCQNLM